MTSCEVMRRSAHGRKRREKKEARRRHNATHANSDQRNEQQREKQEEREEKKRNQDRSSWGRRRWPVAKIERGRCEVRSEKWAAAREEGREQRGKRARRRENKTERPQEAATGPEMKPPEGDRPFPTPSRLKSAEDRRIESLHFKGGS